MSRQRHRRSASDRSRSAVALWPMLSDAAPPQAAASTLSRSNDGLAIANPQRVSECAPRTAASSATAALLLPQTAAMSRAATPPRLPRPPAADPPFQIRLSPELKKNVRSYIFLLVLAASLTALLTALLLGVNVRSRAVPCLHLHSPTSGKSRDTKPRSRRLHRLDRPSPVVHCNYCMTSMATHLQPSHDSGQWPSGGRRAHASASDGTQSE